MLRSFLLLTVAATAMLATHQAHACSMPAYDVGPPLEDLGYDAQESPADPVVSSAAVYDHTIDEGGFGCGGGSTCDGVRTRLTLLEIAQDIDIDRVRVEYTDGTVVHGRWSSAPGREGMIEVPLKFTESVPYDVTVSLYDVDGYESNRITVTVESQTASASGFFPRAGMLLALALCGMTVFTFRRRR